jgi:hypothetical protein
MSHAVMETSQSSGIAGWRRGDSAMPSIFLFRFFLILSDNDGSKHQSHHQVDDDHEDDDIQGPKVIINNNILLEILLLLLLLLLASSVIPRNDPKTNKYLKNDSIIDGRSVVGCAVVVVVV